MRMPLPAFWFAGMSVAPVSPPSDSGVFFWTCCPRLIIVTLFNRHRNMKRVTVFRKSEMAKKQLRGGKRDGAGRKPLDPNSDTVRVATDLPSDLVKRLDAYAEKHEWTRAQAIREAVGLLLNAK
jgi:hypothetical protein